MSECTNNTAPKFLRHYTSIEALYSILDSKTLRFGDPEAWVDENDAASIRAFRRKKGAARAGVICLAAGPEQIHHWNTYAPKGCRIEFDEHQFEEEINRHKLLCGFVHYCSSEDLSAETLRDKKIDELPFIKRRPYEGEQEYRIIWYGSAGETVPEITVKDRVSSITLYPNISTPKFEAIKDNLKTKYQIETVNRSRLLKYDAWISRFDNL
jgi:hypothetical protein